MATLLRQRDRFKESARGKMVRKEGVHQINIDVDLLNGIVQLRAVVAEEIS